MNEPEPKLNWHLRIERARKNGFSAQDEEDSAQWPDCACGEQDSRIPRNPDGSPEDLELLDLGINFVQAVQNGWVNSALEILELIEDRSKFLIQDYEETKEFQDGV